MSFRTRLLLTMAAVVLVSLAVLALGLRWDLTDQLAADYARRIEATVIAIEVDLQLESEDITARLVALRDALQDDNRFRLAAVAGAASGREYLLDYAGAVIGLTGLTVLQIRDDDGRIVSSGHFRNEHGRLAPVLAKRLVANPDNVAFLTARTPEREFMALIRGEELRVGERAFTLVGGVALDRPFFERLARDRDVSVSLMYPGLDVSSNPGLAPRLASVSGVSGEAPGLDDLIAGRLEVTVMGPDGEGPAVSTAYVLVTHTLEPLQALVSRVGRWFMGTAAVTAVMALALAAWLSSRVSRPLVTLAEKTATLDLDRLDIDFASREADEVGTLSRLLGDLATRLKASRRDLREAEHTAAVGQMARQVTHDIKNGLIPLRNVFRHLSQVGAGNPDALATVFTERRGTIDASIDYLETLATNYGRLSPTPARRRCDLNEIATEAIQVSRGPHTRIVGQLAENLPEVVGDPVAVRRILDNLIANAIESHPDGEGLVRIVTARVDDPDHTTVRLTVSDSGCGMSDVDAAKMFADFYTTKPTGTGLGLSIVRRLVLDLEGTVRVSSVLGEGTHVTVQVPAAPTRLQGVGQHVDHAK
jgi:signal transduction histidine kinase